MKKLEPLYIAGENIKQPEKQQFLKLLNMELPHDPAIPLLGIHSREMKTQVHIKSCSEKNLVQSVHCNIIYNPKVGTA